MIDERIAERRKEVREQRRRSRLRRTITIAVLFVLVGVGYAVERSSLVALAEVRIEGTERLRPEIVRSAADLPLGTSTLRLRLGAAERRVEDLPLVADAEISRVDPLTVLVRVTERRPVAVLRAAEGPVLVDDEGVVVARGAEDGLPVIDLPHARAPEPGGTLEQVPAARNAQLAMSALPGPLRSEVALYLALAEDDLELRLLSGTVVRFGRAERVDEKARALGAVLEDLAGRQVRMIDVRAPRAPVVRP